MKNKRLLKVIIINLVVVLSVLLYLIIVTQTHINVYCPYRKFLNLTCPGCGGTRMVLNILRGDFYRAFRSNPFIFITSPILLIVYIIQIRNYITYKPLDKWSASFSIIYTISLIMYGILRNIKGFEFLLPI